VPAPGVSAVKPPDRDARLEKTVSPRYRQSYVNEYTSRHKARQEPGSIFEQLAARAARG
jgi:hypothetical protein